MDFVSVRLSRRLTGDPGLDRVPLAAFVSEQENNLLARERKKDGFVTRFLPRQYRSALGILYVYYVVYFTRNQVKKVKAIRLLRIQLKVLSRPSRAARGSAL
jgi:hypothetical protein